MVQTNEVHTNVASNEDQIRVCHDFKFNDPRAGIFVLGRGHESHIVKMYYFFKTFFSTTRHRSE